MMEGELSGLTPAEVELLESLADLVEARQHMERARDLYVRGDCVLLFVHRAEDRLATAMRRAAQAELAVDRQR
jgi:hypothetical protein